MATPASSGSGEKEQIETVCQLDHARAVMIVPGVMLCPLVDAEQGAKDVLVGVLTIEPDALYPFYTRPVTESLTLLQGSAAVDTEARRHRLAPLDTAAVPGQVPRRVVNLSTTEPAVFQIALGASNPLQTWVNARFDHHDESIAFTGVGHGEWVCRADQAAPWELAPRALFQDLCGGNRGDWDLQGAIGRFEPGARLPCSRALGITVITIVDGAATCIVEGRRISLATGTTLVVPAGLCHYLINLTLDPLVAIWVHAGGRPEQTVLDDSFCHPERKESRSSVEP